VLVRVIVFTKPFGSVGVGQLADALEAVGADGADLVVRDGQTVTPDQPGGIVSVARGLADRGLGLDVVTTDLLAADDTADRVLAACAEAGVSLVRTGFYRYQPDLGYWDCLDLARRALAGLAELAESHGVALAVQLHHGTIHPSAAHAMALVDELDEVRYYADPGNQAKEGSEDWRMCLDQLESRMACMGVKTAAWHRGPHGWSCDWVPMTDGGVVPWPQILAGLAERSFTGPLSLHVHYPTEDVVSAVRADVAHLRGLVVGSAAP
jgi:sugar phosphate isomerase/epimerase